jgi:hypothetical protein
VGAEIKLVLKKDKDTKNSFRFVDIAATDHALAIYLTKEQCKEAGITEMINIVITPAAG